MRGDFIGYKGRRYNCRCGNRSGECGIGIVRISGPEAIGIADRIFRSVSGRTLKELPGRRMNYGYIFSPDDDENIDEVLVVAMKAPHTYTREDIVEVHCHGGMSR